MMEDTYLVHLTTTVDTLHHSEEGMWEEGMWEEGMWEEGMWEEGGGRREGVCKRRESVWDEEKVKGNE